MSTPDPRRGDEPGEPITPAPKPEHDSATPAFDEDQDDPDTISGPEDKPVIEPIDPRDPAPDVNDGEAPQPLGRDDQD